MSDPNNVPGSPEASDENNETTPNTEASSESPAAEEAQAPAAEEAPAPAAEEAQAPAAEEAPAEAQGSGEVVATATPTDTGDVHVGMTISPEEFAARQEEERKRREEERIRKAQEREEREKAYEKLAAFKESGGAFEVEIKERVKGGLRGEFETLRVFLPASHFGMRKNVPEEELAEAIGQVVRVKVHELQSDDTGFKSAVVTRREILQAEFWDKVETGTIHDGVVTSVTDFGAFVNIGGVEGLVHVSRLSRSRVGKPADVVKKGDKLRVTITDVDRDKHKLSLSHKEHEADPWEGIEAKYPAGSRVKGKVMRITDFGAYVQVEPKIEGLLRISELSWTQRVKHPSDILAVDQEIEVEVLECNPAKHQLALGYKQTQPNPWLNIAETLPIGTEVKGTVQQVSAQGAVIRVNDTFDGFMPRSKMVNVGRGKKIELAEGQELDCAVVDLDPGAASLILAMKNEDGSIAGSDDAHQDWSGQGYEGGGRRGGEDRRRGGDDDRRRGGDDRRRGPRESGQGGRDQSHQTDSPGVTLGDLLKDSDKTKLNG